MIGSIEKEAIMTVDLWVILMRAKNRFSAIKERLIMRLERMIHVEK